MALRILCILGLIAAGYFASRGAIRCDGTDDRAAYIHSTTNHNTTNQITLSLWYNMEAGSASGGEVITKGRTINGNKSNYHLRHNSSKWEFYFAAPDATFHLNTTTPTFTQSNTWRHVAFRFTYGTAASARFWVDGTNAASTWTGGSGVAAGLTNAEPLHFGFGATLGFKGQLAEVAGWNVMLDDDEIALLAKSRQKGIPRQLRLNRLMFYYPMDGEFPPFTTASGTNTIKDLSPFLSHGTPFNSPQARPNTVLSEP